MGTCVSRSAAGESGRQQGVATAKVVGVDGTVARYVARVTAREALQGRLGGPDNDMSPYFVCSSDELRFDAPARALAEEELLQAGQLYFVLPASMLRLAISGPDMAALAVRATAALAADASGVSSSRREVRDAAPGPSDGKQRTSAARVAPLAVVVGSPAVDNADSHGEEWYYHHHHAYGKYGTRKTAAHGGGADVTVGKARRGAGYRGGGNPRLPAGMQRLSAISEAID